MAKRTVSFADRLAEVRQQAGLSQYALAKASGLSKQALSQLELGQREPSWATVQALARALRVSTEAFVVEEEPAEAAPAKKRKGKK